MSYCRWSNDCGECAVYVYKDVMGGWTTHVAGRKPRHKLPDKIKRMYPSFDEPDFAERYMAAEEAKQEWIKTFPHEVIPTTTLGGAPGKGLAVFSESEYMDLSELGPEAGESFNDPTPGDCADRLEALRAKGFNVPQYAIDALRAEQKEMDSE